MIKAIRAPLAVTGFFCFSSNLKLSKKLSENNIINDIKNLISHEYDFEENQELKLSHQNLYILDLDCPDATELLLKAEESEMFVAPTRWLILQDIKNNNLSQIDLKKQFYGLGIFPDSELYLARKLKNDSINILSIYRPSMYVNLIFEYRGNWDTLNGVNFVDWIPASQRRRNLHLTPSKRVWCVTYTWRNTWGYQDQNGTWSGMIGLLDRNEIDFGGTATFLIKQRIGVIEYLHLYTPVGSKFVFRKPPLSYVSNLFTLPFGRTVWYAIAVMTCVICGFLYITLKWEWKKTLESQENTRHPDNLQKDPSLSDDLLILSSAIFQQGLSYEPRTISSRIITLMLLLAALSLYASYTANIVALLQSTSNSINTLKDLIQSGLKFGIYDIVYNRYYFGALDDPIRREFRERFVTNKSSVWLTMENGIERVRKGLFAFHVDTAAGYQLMQETYDEDEKCGLQEIDYMGVLDPMLVIKRRSPYREIFKVGSLWLREAGLQQRDTPRLFTKKPVCVGQTSFISVGTTECYAAFYTIIYGVAIAFGVLFIEIIYHRCFESKTDDSSESENDIENDVDQLQESRQTSGESLEAIE